MRPKFKIGDKVACGERNQVLWGTITSVSWNEGFKMFQYMFDVSGSNCKSSAWENELRLRS